MDFSSIDVKKLYDVNARINHKYNYRHAVVEYDDLFQETVCRLLTQEVPDGVRPYTFFISKFKDIARDTLGLRNIYTLRNYIQADSPQADLYSQAGKQDSSITASVDLYDEANSIEEEYMSETPDLYGTPLEKIANSLNDTDMRILRAVTQGYLGTEIANMLGVSPQRVNQLCTSLRKKLMLINKRIEHD